MNMKRVLLTVSGVIPSDLADQVGRGERPRADYAVMRDVFDCDLVDVVAARALVGRASAIVERIGGRGLVLALACFRRRRLYQVIVTDGEQVGLLFAALCRLFGRRGSRHMMIVHVLSVPKKVWLTRALRLIPMIDCFVVYCSAQRDFLIDELGADPGTVVLTPFMVDTVFFDPGAVEAPRRRMICSAGLERRDYPTLIEAVGDLDVDVVIAAASPWSKQADSSAGHALPGNVEIRRLDLAELRAVYAESALVVMPLVDVDFQAGITTILEAMAMRRPVVCSLTRGQNDTVVDGQTGRYVPPGDAGALRREIMALLDDPAESERLGSAARDWVVTNASVEVYARRLGACVERLIGADGGSAGSIHPSKSATELPSDG
jgi:glycosyltransferase involved in cell wall biosynthesis